MRNWLPCLCRGPQAPDFPSWGYGCAVAAVKACVRRLGAGQGVVLPALVRCGQRGVHMGQAVGAEAGAAAGLRAAVSRPGAACRWFLRHLPRLKVAAVDAPHQGSDLCVSRVAPGTLGVSSRGNPVHLPQV